MLYFTLPFVTSKALMAVNLIVLLFFQFPSFGCVNKSRPSIANLTSSVFHSRTSMAIFLSFILIMSISQDSRRPGLEDEMRRHNFVGTSFASRFMWFKCSSIFSWACFSCSRPSKWCGVTLNSRANKRGYLVTLWTGTCGEKIINCCTLDEKIFFCNFLFYIFWICIGK